MSIQPVRETHHRQVIPLRTANAVPRTLEAGRPAVARECAVIMVSYRTGPILAESVHAALDQEGVGQVVLVDNGNTSETRRMLDAIAERDARLSVLRGHGNIGFARACNLGVRHTAAPFVLLLNPDCIIKPGVLARSFDVFEQSPQAAMVTVRIENTDGSEQRGGRRNLLTPWTCLVELFRLDRFMPNHPHFRRLNLNETDPLDSVTPVQCISGAFMMLPRRAYDLFGGMDEDYFLHVEDVDFCMRVQKSGGSILYVPDASVTHLKGTSRVSPLIIEWHKSVSVSKYFRKHFRPQYPDPILRVIAIAIFARLAIRAGPLTLQWLWHRTRSLFDA